MQKQVNVWLSDIKQAISEIKDFLPQRKRFADFQKDLKSKRAIERNIEIIGEAMSRILKQNPKIGISKSRKIVDTRNRISHGYDAVSTEIIWSIIIKDLPLLEKEVDKLLKS